MGRFTLPLLFLFVATVFTYAACAPQSLENTIEIKPAEPVEPVDRFPLSHKEFVKRRNENVQSLIKKNGLTCDNLDSFCYKEIREDPEDLESLAQLACKVILETYLCEDKKLPDDQ